MNRREFMHLLGIGAVSVAAPKLIFDMGKNSRIYAPKFEPYKLYQVGDRFGVYQPDGTFFYGPGIAEVRVSLIDSKLVTEIVASTSADYPQGKKFYSR